MKKSILVGAAIASLMLFSCGETTSPEEMEATVTEINIELEELDAMENEINAIDEEVAGLDSELEDLDI
jgi:peptidoglycan hydrolase CwlO-like protein